MDGAGTVYGCGFGEGWQWPGSSFAIPGTGAGQDSRVLGVLVDAGVSWMGSILLFISCPNTTGSPACPDITLGAPMGSPGWGFRDQIPCFQPHFQWLEAPDPAGKEELWDFGDQKGAPQGEAGPGTFMSWKQRPSPVFGGHQAHLASFRVL